MAQCNECRKIAECVPEDRDCNRAGELFASNSVAGTTEYGTMVAVSIPASAMVFRPTNGAANNVFLQLGTAKRAKRLFFTANDP